MSIRRVGREVSASEYWIERSNSYNSRIDGAYHTHRLAVVKALLDNCGMDSSLSVDFGCGDGVLLEYLARKNARVVGCDPVEEMVVAAERRLSQAGFDAKVSTGGIEVLSSIETASVDNLLAINVIAYFSEEEEKIFYSEAARIVRKGGALVTTHSNELFDLYTLNAFTLAFYTRHFCTPENEKRVASLLTHPNVPERIWFNVRENPLNYRYKLKAYGFEEAQQEFANLHAVPPLLMDAEALADIDKREYADTLNWDESERWKLMFVCSMFGSRSVRL